MARPKIRNRVAMANMERSLADQRSDKKAGIPENSKADRAADVSLLNHVNASDRRHKQTFKKNPPTPVPPSKNIIQRPKPARGK